MAQKTVWIYGVHAVEHALKNPKRRVVRALALSSEDAKRLEALRSNLVFGRADKKIFSDLFGAQAVHQGVALEAYPLEEEGLEDFCKQSPQPPLILALDQVTDPHNVGAIIRSAAAFGVDGIIMQDRHSPDQLPLVAKTASGALEYVSLLSVVNISRALEYLKEQGYWIVGLDERGEPLGAKVLPTPTVLVLGAEGRGLRPLVAKTCDLHVRLPTCTHFPTLNVSNAAAIALYACCGPQAQGGKP